MGGARWRLEYYRHFGGNVVEELHG